MKSFLQSLSIACVLLIAAFSASAQSVIYNENFPNTYNTGNTAATTGTFTGSTGTWNVAAGTGSAVQVDDDDAVVSSQALGFSTTGGSATSATVTSPVQNLLFGSCTPSGVNFSFQLKPQDVNAGNSSYTLSLQFYDGSTWNTVWDSTSGEMSSNMGTDDYELTTISIPNTYWNATFQYRFISSKANGTTGNSSSNAVWIDEISLAAVTTGPAFPDFSDATITVINEAGSAGAYEAGDVFRYDNVITFPEAIYAEVKIEAIQNAVVTNLDNNGAGIAQRFQPRIRPNPQSMSADQEGYVQFAITFKKASDNTTVLLSGLRYRHFDVDGSTSSDYSFRETGWITGHSSLLGNSPSDLTIAGPIVSGPPAGTNWSKVLGELDEHDGITSDPDVSFTATYGSVSTIRFRLGYIYDKITTNAFTYDPGAEGREYATEFGCFSLAQQTTLPVKLLSFTGTYHNNASVLNWETVNEDNFAGFEIERSSNGSSFATIGAKQATAGSYSSRKQYNYFDDLSAAGGTVFYYRLKMIDEDGKFKYSNVIMIRKEQKSITGVTINPNPVVTSETATVRFSSEKQSVVELRVVDMSGRVVITQQNKAYAGNNSLTLNNLHALQPGVYTLQMINADEVSVVKFSVTK